jgi:hypothetical protein
MLNSTRNWLRRHRVATATTGAALTALMLAPELTDAGHRRHARHCGGQGYGYAQSVYHGHYQGGGGYSGGTIHHGTYGGNWGSGYTQGGIVYDSGSQFQGSQFQGSQPFSEGQPRMAEQDQSSDQRIVTNRPADDSFLPPAPEQNAQQQDQQMADGAQQQQEVQRLRQQVQSLEQEVSRLEDELRQARQDSTDASVSSEAEAQADTQAETEAADEALPSPPDADAEAADENAEI